MKKERMKKLADFIRDLPRLRFNMGNFVEWVEADEEGDHTYLRDGQLPITNGCDTRMCIAGWTCFLAGEHHLTNRDDIAEQAAIWLGLTPRQASHLFYGEWGDYFNDEGRRVTFMDWREDRLSNTERAAEAIEAMIADQHEPSGYGRGR